MARTSAKTAKPAPITAPSTSVPSSDPVISFTYSQLAELLHESQSAQLDVRARLTKLLRETQALHGQAGVLPKEIQDAIERAKEPRRQKKIRTIKARVGYVLQSIRSKQQFAALNTLLPGEAQVLSFIGTHHRPSVQDIATGVELSVKTVKNYVSTLVQKRLITSVKL